MKTDKHQYDDIIHLPHHQSTTRKRMSMMERAAQFNAFQALNGYGDAVAETARLTETRVELDECVKAEINAKLQFLQEQAEEEIEVTVTYFLPDKKKAGGKYVTAEGVVSKIQKTERVLVIEGDLKIPIDEILSIESAMFRSVFEDYE